MVAICLLATLVSAAGKHTSRFEWVFLGLLWLAFLGLSFELLWSRIVIRDGHLQIYSLLPKSRLRTPIDEITAYRMDKSGHWWIETEERKVKIVLPEPWELHRALVELAPKKLGGRRLRFPGVIPEEDLVGLWNYDIQNVSNRIGLILAVMMVFFFFDRRTPWAIVVQLSAPLYALLARSWGRLDVTADGIVLRAAWVRRSIPWSDVKAIFCEKRPKRSFVIVGSTCAIEIPAHLAIEKELMQKVLHSIPHFVLCVNFDETTMRGCRKRKAMKKEAKTESLLPALTT